MSERPLLSRLSWRVLLPVAALIVTALALVMGPVRQAVAQDGPQAFAVYTADNTTLTLYKASNKPARNDTYNGKTVTYVFTIDETKTNYSSSPFSGYAREYESVVFAAPEYADDKIAPASMSNWFSGFEKATSITGWENVDGSNIQSMSRAFEYCYALTSIDLSDLRLTKATDLSWLFSGCTSLETADLTGLVRSGVTTITYMFNNCSALTELNLLSWNTSGITENNADWMFNGVTSLEKVTLGDRFDFVAGYGVSLPDVAGKLWYLTDENGDPTGTGYTGEDLAEAWDGDTMCGTWVLSEPIAESGPEAFAVYCEADKTLTIYKASDKPTEGEQYNGKAATRVFDIDETATSLSASPFADVAEDVTLVQIAAPESADDKLTPACTAHWFDGFANLTQVADWQNADTSQVTDMSYMYRGCNLSNGFDAPDLKTGSVTTMSHMFDGCTGLRRLTVRDCPRTLFVMADRTTTTNPIETAYLGRNIEPAGTSQRGFFYDDTALTRVTFGPDVTRVGNYLFHGCSALPAVSLPEGLTAIGSHAFAYCSQLDGLRLPAGVNEIGENAFTGCEALTAIDIPAGVTTLGYGLFADCFALAHVTLPAGLTAIEGYAFHACRSLPDITLPDAVDEIGYATFEGCTALAEVHLPAGLTRIGERAFTDCISLASIELPDGVTEVGYMAFADCSALADVSLGDRLASIGGSAFEDCALLREITLPYALQEIGSSAFADCEALMTIRSLATTPPDIDEDVFDTKHYLRADVHIPQGTLDAYVATNWGNFAALHDDIDVSAVSSVETEAFTVSTEGGVLLVGGMPAGGVSVYGADGRLVYRGSDACISLPRGSVYVVRAAGRSCKVAL